MLISVCMCTYKREHLALTLESIGNLELEKNVELEVVVVDNDIAMSGKPICDILSSKFPYPISYVSEPKRNISSARNKCLEVARGDWIAFIDDDEVADKDWLRNLLVCANQFDAQVVFGRVKTVYPSACPQWIKDGRFFERKVKKTGSVVSSGGCGSTLLNNLFRSRFKLKFDEEYGLSGGEDADFFYRFHLFGAKLVNCHEAFVKEEVEPQRLNSKYLVKRTLRVGQTFTKYRFSQSGFSKDKVKFVAKTSAQAFGLLFLILINLPLGKHRYFNMYLKLVDKYGKLSFFVFKKSQNIYN